MTGINTTGRDRQNLLGGNVNSVAVQIQYNSDTNKKAPPMTLKRGLLLA